MDMAELEIDQENVNDRKKYYEEEVQPYLKMEYKPIIIICAMAQREAHVGGSYTVA